MFLVPDCRSSSSGILSETCVIKIVICVQIAYMGLFIISYMGAMRYVILNATRLTHT